MHLPEYLIRRIWRDQSFTTTHLHVSDGRAVTIHTPGRENHDAGPDFLDARVRIGSTTYRGDVEIHVDLADWNAHRHSADPHYNRVILHVVVTTRSLTSLTRTASGRTIPLLVLQPYLDPACVAAWRCSLQDDGSVSRSVVRCAGTAPALSRAAIARWLDGLAEERLEMKICRLEERLGELADERSLVLRDATPHSHTSPGEVSLPAPTVHAAGQYGSAALWEQLLYEGVAEGLGYTKNQEAFRTLARELRLATLRGYGLSDLSTMLALTLGVAGLLPASRHVQEKENRAIIRDLRRRWRALGPSLHVRMLHEADWLLFRLRPASFPPAGIAILAHLLPHLFDGGALKRIITSFRMEGMPAAERLRSMRACFAFNTDDFWRHHYHCAGKAGRTGIALGYRRIDEIVVNTILPLVILYARTARQPQMEETAKKFLRWIPAPAHYVLTHILAHDVLRDHPLLRTACGQQGTLQLYTMYCVANRCGECVLGRALEEAGNAVRAR